MNHSENENKICAVIPFYNEHSTLKEIVKRTLPFVDRIILINDGSTDEFTNQIPVNGKVILISHENRLIFWVILNMIRYIIMFKWCPI